MEENKSIIITYEEIEYNNSDYALIYNKNTKIITEKQDGEITGDTNIINTLRELQEVKEDYFADWDYIGFIAGNMEEKFFNEIAELF